MKVFEETGIVEYLQKHDLTTQYLKAKKYLEEGFFDLVDLRKRKPKKLNIFYFKINKKYRALGYIEQEAFIVTEILNHQ